ncbi:unnamed protein product (macronuclear) [Paramecium tetraurelia]|uniref:Chromosome undetermined scaffold_1, whole genome shotgun sequence n=1 Tax=Paramecium tetraurelia TaxID=5888 RepID=Q6BFP4_PARTE|nr:Lipid-binding protein [Paramecium tetraurelia strain d4-2]XP_001423131.1 uncharacterized protein GSPATT00000168001 [Paramecium tetraurelia]CAH03526.1 Lipid-binding protein, putative [Paramecium tetraurelia]CAK55733.1 unnamed protein product [Paramecium tetraurelia]|eukprot:XP_001423131.1 hypothetical protein (macronuclear) [Paramecium tetraurelia strain d4-2]
MNQRPIKNGYLQQKHIFGLKTTKFYYLEGTQFLIFEDDKTHIPQERIDLSGFIVDGTWQEDGYYTFTLRHLQQEIIMQFISMTYDDAAEWVSKIKQAILISEYEALLHQSNYQISIDQNRLYKNDSSNVTKNIPEYVQKQLQLYQELSKDKWIIEKTLKQMKLTTIQSQSNIVLKGEYVFNTSLQNVITIIQKGGKLLDLFIKSSEVHEIDCCQCHQDVWHFNNDGKKCVLESKYIQFDFQRNNSFFLTRESISQGKFPMVITNDKQQQKNLISMFKVLEIIHVVEEDSKCFTQYMYVVKKDENEKVIRKLMKEQIINLSIISTELDLLLMQINNESIPITQSRIVVGTDHSNQDNLENEFSKGENIHFPPQDRLGYVDNQLQPNQPAAIYENMHKRITHQDEEQLKALAELKERIGHLYLNDQTMIRYLIARNYKVKDTEKMILKCLQWRKENKINSRKTSDYQIYANENVHTQLGFSRWGHPILVTNGMNSHPEKFESEQGFSEQGYLEYHQSLMEEGIRSMRGYVDQFIVIIDCYKLTPANFSFSVLKNAFIEIFNYYPERQFRIYVLNTNFLTRSFYAMLKPFLPSRTVEKINFIGQDFNEIKTALLRDLDEETIPKRYGGQNILIQ